ncbi:membrane or secreted protein [Candidatus Magnetobacterium bavaricum]|uniref:Membrane or secreted protein n=1 Tax=Candidatus Magnetobacterium bavaricum TaxID=29290 RepID=A0A0F3GT81_9BACT|nr:membrane or secreted protein [Candidatus Magnetobacterium bavaricum]
MKKSETITLIYFRDKSGKARTFKMARSVFAFLIAFMLLLPVASFYLGLRFKAVNNDLPLNLANLEKENAALKQSLKSLETKRLNFISQVQKPDANSTKPEDFDSKIINTGQVDANALEITNLEEKKLLIISFDVINLHIPNTKITGYVFIVWKVDDKYYGLPQSAEIKNGTPVKYNAGESFDIKIKKHFTKTLSTTLDKIRLLYLLVYDDKGTIILKKNVDLGS